MIVENPQYTSENLQLESTISLKRKLEERIIELENSEKKLKMETEVLKKQLKTKQQSERRLKKKINSLESALNYLRDLGFISESYVDELDKCLEGIPKELVSRILTNKDGKACFDEYPEQLKAFSLTLHFYSPKAYTYVREALNSALPHPRQIRRIYSKINGEPGKIQHT